MVKRFSLRPYLYVAFALIVMIACWESNRAHAALLDPGIPEEAIRLRILANSDSPEDQLVKRAIREELTRRMSGWAQAPQTIQAARDEINAHMPEIERVVGEVLAQYGYHYGYKAELGQVPFPAKVYGNKVYPAGDYEALRITLGIGTGENWWCVLFPPLCFVDGKGGATTVEASAVKASAAEDGDVKPAPKQEVKFFVWEVSKKVGGFIKGLFA